MCFERLTTIFDQLPPRMSVMGHERTLAREFAMSASPPTADMLSVHDVCKVPKTNYQATILSGRLPFDPRLHTRE